MKEKIMQYKFFRDNFEFQKEQAYSEQAFKFAQKNNTMKNKKIYCGSGKKRSENWITATINLAKFKDHVQEYEGHKFLKLNINLLDEADKYGKDVQISINQYKPEVKEVKEVKSEDDLPF